MPFSNILPSLPLPVIDIIVNVVAALGAVLITYAIFLEAERRQDAVFVVASACLLVYSLWLGNIILSIAMAGLMIGAFIELLEIMMGKHNHSDLQVEKYRHPNNK